MIAIDIDKPGGSSVESYMKEVLTLLTKDIYFHYQSLEIHPDDVIGLYFKSGHD